MRKRFDWYHEMLKLRDPEIEKLFLDNHRKLIRGKQLSKNRCAYYALKMYYSTTSIDELAEKLGLL